MAAISNITKEDDFLVLFTCFSANLPMKEYYGKILIYFF